MMQSVDRKTMYSIRFMEKKSEGQESESIKKIKRPKSVSSNRQGYMKTMNQFAHMSSIKKAVKNNDISFLIHKKPSKTLTQPSDSVNLTFEDAAHHKLIQVRKKYDSMKKQRISKFQQTQTLKNRVKTLDTENYKIKQILFKDKDQTQKNKQKLDRITSQLEVKCLDKDILINMKKRLQQDIKFYKDKLSIAQRKEKMKKIELQKRFKQYETLIREEGNTDKIYYKFQKQLDNQQKQREAHIQNVLESIDYKMETIKNQETWSEFVNVTAIETLLQKDSSEKQWDNLILVNLFFKKILNSKIITEMEKFSEIQKAFRNIKTKTQVSDYETFVDRYLMRDKIYGQLLAKVSQCKNTMQELTQKHNTLLRQNERLEERKEQIENQRYLTQNRENFFEKNEELRKYDEQATMIQQLKLQLRQWVTRQILKINRASKTETNEDLLIPRDIPSLTFKLKNYLEMIMKLLSKIDQEQQLLNLQLGESNKNKTKLSKKASLQDPTMIPKLQNNDIPNRKNSQIYQIQEQMTTLNAQRTQIHQKNEKFLRDARMKFNSTRKLMPELKNSIKK